MKQSKTSIRSILLPGIGVLALAAGFYVQTNSGSVPATDKSRCEGIIQTIYGDNAEVKASLIPKCSEPGMVAMMDAKANGSSATEAAQAIASANQSDISTTLLSYGLMGLGVGALFSGVASMLNARKRA